MSRWYHLSDERDVRHCRHAPQRVRPRNTWDRIGNKTVFEKVAIVRRELSISDDLTFKDAIIHANSMMGFENTGTLVQQLDTLVMHLSAGQYIMK